MALASAVLGPLLDNQHSMYGALSYTHPIRITLPGLLIETTWWTPLLFGLAGIIIGVGTPALDAFAAAKEEEKLLLHRNISQEGPSTRSMEPSWGWVFLGISAFVVQYWVSAVLDTPLQGVTVPWTAVPAADVVLATGALATWAIFDATPQGFFMAALTGVAGPVVEIGLISQDLYHYAHPQIFDAVPTWIAWTYFAGGPAVGNLGRKTAAILQRKRLKERE